MRKLKFILLKYKSILLDILDFVDFAIDTILEKLGISKSES
jgi:hypothetical protein